MVCNNNDAVTPSAILYVDHNREGGYFQATLGAGLGAIHLRYCGGDGGSLKCPPNIFLKTVQRTNRKAVP